MKRNALVLAMLLGVGATAISLSGQAPSGADRLTADVLKGLEVRSIGPALVTGRIADLAIDPKNPSVWYVASAFGGLWKTVNRGVTFTPIFDQGPSFTLCCVVVDPKDSDVVWLGTGENASQRSAHFGDGVYKSVDAGKTWRRVGLESSEHIGKILLDPRDSNTVFVASQGPLFSAGGDRGLFKTTDGGATWKAVLTISPDTGVSDVVLDPNKPDVMYASAYQRRRHVGQMIGGGPEGGIFKSTDAGKTWKRLAGGLPSIQVRDLSVQRRENDLVLATFGRGFYVLDDYSALRDINPTTLGEDARLFPMRDALLYHQLGMAPAGSAGIGPLAGLWTAANPPYGAVFTYHVRQDLPADTKLVLTISDESGKQVRRLDLDRTEGLRRVAWNLRGDPPAPAAGGQGGGQGFGGFGRPQAPLAVAGRYRATLGKLVGDKVTPVGPAQTFLVVQD